MTDRIVIAGRFNGPADSGNGGYSCGLLADRLDGPARVRLFIPPPLDTPLSVAPNDKGGFDLRLDAKLVASAWPGAPSLDVPGLPGVERAAEARQGFPAYERHLCPSCYVCGIRRPGDDGLNLHPGPVGDGRLVACDWRPQDELLDEAGHVRPEFVWAALDCPGYFGAAGEGLPMALLGELCAELRRPVPGNETLVVAAWPTGRDGRKLYAGSAIARGNGEVLAVAESTWIILR
jgi:hypothetical protein